MDISIKNAKVHNLRGIDVTIPRNSLTVVTGLSGSGKSSLAFDTLYAEGQRRYVESLSAYARQFLDRMDCLGRHPSPASFLKREGSHTVGAAFPCLPTQTCRVPRNL